MRVFLIFTVLSLMGVLTSNLVEGMRARTNAGVLGRSNSKDHLLSVLSVLPTRKTVLGKLSGLKGKRSSSGRISGSPGGSPSREGSFPSTPITGVLSPEEEEISCAQQLSKALADMGLGNLVEESLNKNMAKELENQLLAHFEKGSEPDDFLMNYGEFKQARTKTAPNPAVPNPNSPEVFDISEQPEEGENETATLQRRCSKKCSWLYGYMMKPVVQEIDEPGNKGATLLEERAVTPLVLGQYSYNRIQPLVSRLKFQPTSPHRCSCLTTTDFDALLTEYHISKRKFSSLKRTSSVEALNYLKNKIQQENNGLQLLEHEAFVELVTFEILKHVREKEDRGTVMREVRDGVFAANEEYRDFMSRLATKLAALSTRKSSSWSFGSGSWSFGRRNSGNKG